MMTIRFTRNCGQTMEERWSQKLTLSLCDRWAKKVNISEYYCFHLFRKKCSRIQMWNKFEKRKGMTWDLLKLCTFKVLWSLPHLSPSLNTMATNVLFTISHSCQTLWKYYVTFVLLSCYFRVTFVFNLYPPIYAYRHICCR